VVIAGIVLLLIAVAAYFVVRDRRRRLGALAATATLPCNALVADQTCEVAGIAQPGPDGALAGPSSRKPCVWHRQTVTQHWQESERDSDGDPRRVHKSNVLWDESSSDLFTVRDSTGEVLVNPEEVTVDHPVKSHDLRADRNSLDPMDTLLSLMGSRSDEEIEVKEWIIPIDEALYVRGTPVQTDYGLIMNDPRDGHFLISARSKQELAKSAKLWATVATVLGFTAAVAGVALIIVGAVS
jgi:hypothetical protein